MQTGTIISGLAHLGLLGWVILAGTFRTDPLPMQVQEISVVSGEEFAALMTAQSEAPVVAPAPEPPRPPSQEEAPQVASPPEPVAEPEPPADVAEPEADLPPELPVVEAPAAEIVDTLPELPQPEAEPVEEDVAALLPTTPRPKPRPAERVAPRPVAAPPPEAEPDPVAQAPVTEEGEGEEKPQEERAPEAASTRIVTEAEAGEDDLAPTQSPRPPSRPKRVASRTTETPSETPKTQDRGAAVNDALAAALSGAEGEPSRPAGPPLSQGERDALRVAVSQCWNVGSLSSAALEVTVVLAVSMTDDAKPIMDTIRMVSHSGGTPEDARQAYEAARRAVIRCGARGFNLPSEKFAQWRDIEMTFNPERMRSK